MTSGVTNILAVLILGLAALAFGIMWVVALADVARRDERDFPPLPTGRSSRPPWLFIVAFPGGVGGIFYYLQVMRPYPRR